MKSNLSEIEQHRIRKNYDDLNVVIDAIHIISESTDATNRCSNALLLVLRQIAKTADDICNTFGADWPENK